LKGIDRLVQQHLVYLGEVFTGGFSHHSIANKEEDSQ